MDSAHTSSLFIILPTYQSLLSHTKMLVLPARGSGSDLCSYHSTYLPTYLSITTHTRLLAIQYDLYSKLHITLPIYTYTYGHNSHNLLVSKEMWIRPA